MVSSYLATSLWWLTRYIHTTILELILQKYQDEHNDFKVKQQFSLKLVFPVWTKKILLYNVQLNHQNVESNVLHLTESHEFIFLSGTGCFKFWTVLILDTL